LQGFIQLRAVFEQRRKLLNRCFEIILGDEAADVWDECGLVAHGLGYF